MGQTKKKISGQSDVWIMRYGVIEVKNGVWYRQAGKMAKGRVLTFELRRVKNKT
jgi:hypothetical protein